MMDGFVRVVVCLAITSVLAAGPEVFRISKVLPAGSENSETMELKHGDETEQLLVAKEAIVTGEDVEDAYAVPEGAGMSLGVKLSEQGGEKMAAATRKATVGVDRLAIVIDGEVVMAPVLLQSELGKNISITLGEKDWKEVSDLADRIMGRESESRMPNAESHPPLVFHKTVPYTEKEYQEVKALREKVGVFFRETIPTDEELDASLRKGMEFGDVVAMFGKATGLFGDREKGDFTACYDLAPELGDDDPNDHMTRRGFMITFEGGGVVRWSLVWSSQKPRMKRFDEVERKLMIVPRDLGYSTGEVNPLRIVEEIEIPDPAQEVTRADIYDLLYLVWQPCQYRKEYEIQSIDANCDVLTCLSRHLPHIRKCRNEAENGRVELSLLETIVRPFILEGKTVPDPAKEADPAGRD